MNKVQVFLKGLTEIVGGSKMGLLVLTNQMEDKQIAIVCDKAMAHELNIRIGQNSLRHKLLPEVLCWINPDMDTEHYEILFNSIEDGQYKVVLVNKLTFEMTPIRASDAILLAQIAQLEIFMEERLFMRQSVPYELGKSKVALPLNALTSEMLEEALQRAIENENYELASNFRDELNRRKENKNETV